MACCNGCTQEDPRRTEIASLLHKYGRNADGTFVTSDVHALALDVERSKRRAKIATIIANICVVVVVVGALFGQNVLSSSVRARVQAGAERLRMRFPAVPSWESSVSTRILIVSM